MRNAALYSRGLLSTLIVALGVVILVRMIPLAHSGGFAILPGVVLGLALIAYGVHKISLIVRIRRTQ
ncbi:MAG TPA: hypothetical protein VK760_15460 [Candidatus Acidoferrales bacterium]|nr:hypothetical protein [Candidatus Acidoferrales bacterium]